MAFELLQFWPQLSVPSPLIQLFACCLHLSHWSCFKCLATPHSLLPQDLCTSSDVHFFFFICTLLDSDACRSWPQRLSQVRSSCFTHKWYCVSFFVYIPLAKAAHMAKPDATGSGKTGPWKPINHPQGKVGKITVYPQDPARARLNVRSVNGSNENTCKRKWNGEEEEDNLHS